MEGVGPPSSRSGRLGLFLVGFGETWVVVVSAELVSKVDLGVWYQGWSSISKRCSRGMGSPSAIPGKDYKRQGK